MAEDPSIEEQRAFYDWWNVEHRSKIFETIPEEVRCRGEKVIEAIQSLPFARPSILEIGCGTGWLTERLTGLGEVTAIDLSPAAISVACERQLGATLIAGDFFQHEFEKQFNVLVCVETIFYVTDQLRFVERMAEYTIENGYLVLTGINRFVYERSSDIDPPAPGQVRRWISVRQLRQLIASNFEILSLVTVAPRGDRGILRWSNSYRLNKLLRSIFPQEVITRWKERVGLGGGIVLVARKRSV